jgi:hypothetical protein
MRCPVCFRNTVETYPDIVAPDCDPTRACTHCDYVVWEDWMHRLSEQEIRQDRMSARCTYWIPGHERLCTWHNSLKRRMAHAMSFLQK